MSNANAPSKTDWAEDVDPDLPTALPPPQTTRNKDGSQTRVTYSFNEEGKKVKLTQRVRQTTVRKTEKPSVAERRTWAKFGLEAGRAAGPHPDTTTVGENIIFRPQVGFKAGAAPEKSAEEEKKAEKLRSMAIKCRICQGDHFTSKCPFRDTMAPEGEAGAGLPDMSADAGKETMGQLGAGGSSYVPPHMRKGAGGASAGERMGGKYERDDLATLRVTNVSEFAEENEMRDLFERFGRVTRVFLAKDRDTGRAKGFAFVSFADRSDASNALDKLDGFGYHHLILKVEFAKKAT